MLRSRQPRRDRRLGIGCSPGSDVPLRSPRSSSRRYNILVLFFLPVVVFISCVASYKITISAIEDESKINNLRRPLQSPTNNSPTTFDSIYQVNPRRASQSQSPSPTVASSPSTTTKIPTFSPTVTSSPSNSTKIPTYSPTVTSPPTRESFPLDEVWPRRPEWKGMDYFEIREDLFNCDDNYHNWPDRPLPTEEQWDYFKQVRCRCSTCSYWRTSHLTCSLP